MRIDTRIDRIDMHVDVRVDVCLRDTHHIPPSHRVHVPQTHCILQIVSVLLGITLVFRTQLAYSRFWEGPHISLTSLFESEGPPCTCDCWPISSALLIF